MKALFIAYNQAYNMEIVDILDTLECRGFTMWRDVSGRGSKDGEPHYGDHAWPTLNNAVLTIVPDEKVDGILRELRIKDEETPALGLRACVWSVDNLY